jgi:cell division protein FtsB
MANARAHGLIAEIRRRALHALWPALALCAFSYFAYHAVHGNRGILAWHVFDSKIAEARARVNEIRAERHALEHRVRLLRPETLDPDLLEESARQVLGYSHSDEVIIRIAPETGR